MLKVTVSTPSEIDSQRTLFPFSVPSFMTEANTGQVMDFRVISDTNVNTLSGLVGDIKQMLERINTDFLFAVCVLDEDKAEEVFDFLQAWIGFEATIDLSFDELEDKTSGFFIQFMLPQEADLLRQNMVSN